MSELNIRIPEELFVTAESSCFEGIYDLGTLKTGVDEYSFQKPISWKIRITNTGDALYVSGTATGTGRTNCGRCLDPFEIDIVGEIEGYFLLHEEEHPSNSRDDVDYEVLGEDKTIDIEPFIASSLLLELPLIPLCRENCRGLCQSCGQNLNESLCDCDHEKSQEQENPFSILKDLKISD